MSYNDDQTGNWVPPYHSSYYNTFGGGPSAMGPNAALVLPETDIVELVNHHHNLRHYYRRRLAWDKWDIYRENFGHLVTERIGFVHSDQTVKRELAKHVDLSINLALDVIRETSVLWKHGANRYIEGASDDAQEAFHDLVKESKFSVHSPGWNELANFLGPTTVVPVMRDDKLTWDTLLPHFYEAIPNPSDPFGAPKAVIWDTRPTNYRGYAFQDNEAREANYIVLDAEAWTYCKQVSKEKNEIVARVPHRLGFFPGETLRFSVSHEQDWWGHDLHRRLVDATVNICRLLSSLSFLRKSQDKRLLTIIGNLEGIPKGQVVTPEKGLVADTQQEGTESVSIDALDIDTSPENYVSHISFIMQRIVSSYGGTLEIAAQGVAGAGKFSTISFNEESLTEIRNAQIPFARDFEHGLWWKSVAMARQMRHPLAEKLPTVDEVKEGFTVQFPKLARTFADPRVEAEYLEFGLRHGMFSYADLLKRENPTLTDEQAQDRVLATIEKQLPVIEAITKRDLSLNPQNVGDPELKTVSQMNGAQGPQVRDNTNPNDEAE
jgi:hypothetical protein